MRKYLEQEILIDALKGRVIYSCTTYPGMDGSGIFEICVDGKTIKQFSMETVAVNQLHGQKAGGKEQFWAGYWKQKNSVSLINRVEFDDSEFCEELSQYRSMQITEALENNNPIIRMFAILDRRVGKRTLKKISDLVEQQPTWLQYFYFLRLDAEKTKI